MHSCTEIGRDQQRIIAAPGKGEKKMKNKNKSKEKKKKKNKQTKRNKTGNRDRECERGQDEEEEKQEGMNIWRKNKKDNKKGKLRRSNMTAMYAIQVSIQVSHTLSPLVLFVIFWLVYCPDPRKIGFTSNVSMF